MSKQTINIGASPNDGTGTPLRTSFDYTNQNFTELYTALGGGVGLPGATTQVIFNDGGTNLAGDAGLVYNKTTDALTVAGLVTAGSAAITGAATVGTNLGVTGDLTVATSILKVTTSNVGIGTATPNTNANRTSLTLNNASWGGQLDINVGAVNHASFGTDNFSSGLSCRIQSADGIVMKTAGGILQQISSAGVFTFQDGAGGTRMTLNSTGLGVGVTPYASWPATSKALQLGASASIEGRTNDGSRITVYSNTVFNGTNLIYQNTAAAAYYQQAVGVHSWYTSNNTPSAGNTATFTQAMTLDASGNLLVGTTNTTGDITNAKRTTGGIFTTINNLTIFVASGAATTIFAAPSESTLIVTASLNGSSDPVNYNAVAIVKVAGGVATVTTISSAALMTITISGLNVQATQTSGGAGRINYTVLRIA